MPVTTVSRLDSDLGISSEDIAVPLLEAIGEKEKELDDQLAEFDTLSQEVTLATLALETIGNAAPGDRSADPENDGSGFRNTSISTADAQVLLTTTISPGDNETLVAVAQSLGLTDTTFQSVATLLGLPDSVFELIAITWDDLLGQAERVLSEAASQSELGILEIGLLVDEQATLESATDDLLRSVQTLLQRIFRHMKTG